MKKKQNIESFLNGLSPLEEDFMRALWGIECGEISDVIPHMVHSEAPYTTIASTVQKLEKKEYIRRIGKKRGFVYQPAISENTYCANTLKYVVSNFFTGSYKGLIQNFAEEGKISAKELEEILQIIETGSVETNGEPLKK